MHELIASRFMDEFLLMRPGHRNGITIGRTRYQQLAASGDQDPPGWLLPAVARAWPDLSLPGGAVTGWLLVRPLSPYGYARASYELNLGCNYDCPMCYLGMKEFSGRRGSFRAFTRGLAAAREAGLNLHMNVIVVKDNAHQVGAMTANKVGRDEQISLIDEGTAGLDRLGAIADSLLLRTGGCAGCQLSGACTVCRPLAKRYQQARAPLHVYCQHGQKERR
jgi:hypothetical protein